MPRLEQNITNPYWITIRPPEIDIMHQSSIIKTREIENVSNIVTIHCHKLSVLV